jgi:dipeptidyl aminopeptidase/acylaminoacyl peptidase
MGAIRGQFAHHDQVGLCKWMCVRLVPTLFVLGTLIFAAGLAPAAKAAVVPSLVAYSYGEGDGIGIVQFGSPHTAAPIFTTTPPSEDAASPSWSPNGLTLAFEAYSPETGNEIVLTNRGGRVIAVPLTHANGGGELDWSPDGTQIAYLCLNPPVLTLPGSIISSTFFNVCVLNVVTGATRVLAESTFSEGIPNDGGGGRLSWSPRGDVIAVDGEHDIATGACTGLACGQPDIAVIDVATGKMAPLGDTGFGEPEFSPNGSEIAFENVPGTAMVNSEPSGIDIMSASGGDIHHVISNGDDPNWSPDGKDIVFDSFQSDLPFSALFSVSVHGGRLTDVTDNPSANNYDPTWVQPLTLCTVPKLKGQTLASTKRLVALAGCSLGKVTGPKKNTSKLHVVSQKPRAGANVATGTKVNIQIR